MDTERERERESECERGLKYLWSTTSQGSAGLQHCPPGEQVDSVSVPAGPSWQLPDGSLVSITWMCTHTVTHSIYIYIYAVYIFFTHSLLQYCRFALQFERHEFYKWRLIFIVSVTCSQCDDDKCTVQWPEWPEEKAIAPLSDMI